MSHQAPIPHQPTGPPAVTAQTHLLNTPKSVGTAYPLLVFLGVFGVHRFYIKSVGLGLLYLFTLGCLGIGPLVDLFILAGRVDRANRRIASEHAAVQS